MFVNSSCHMREKHQAPAARSLVTGKNKIKRALPNNPPLAWDPCPARAGTRRAAMGPALGPAATLLPLPKMAPLPPQRGGHAKPALGSLHPCSGSTGWRVWLCRVENEWQGRAAAPLEMAALSKGDVALLLSLALQNLRGCTKGGRCRSPSAGG